MHSTHSIKNTVLLYVVLESPSNTVLPVRAQVTEMLFYTLKVISLNFATLNFFIIKNVKFFRLIYRLQQISCVDGSVRKWIKFNR